jgi:hypothetical protein
MRKILTLTALVALLSGCAVVTLPVKVAAKTVDVAVDVID